MSLSADALLAEAIAVAGCRDFGDEDFVGPFTLFVKALNRDVRLTEEGWRRTKSHVLKMLVARLGMFKDRATYPEIAAEEIRAPVFVTGQSRSGTSFLYGVISADARNHAPRHWQIWTPSPPPGLPSTDTGRQIAAGERFIQSEGWQDPQVREKHDYSNEGVAEDTLIQDFNFASNTFAFFWDVPSYAAWLPNADLRAAYAFERKMLQTLQFGDRRDRWVLKSPIHLSQLPQLFEVFPDARIVVTHRDPAKSLGSVMSLLQAHRQQFGNPPPDLNREFALAMMEGVAISLAELIRLRSDPGFDSRFVDVGYFDLTREPLAEVERIYAALDITLPTEARQAMQRYIAENRKGQFGRHSYRIEDYGLRPDEVRERFRFYMDHFDVPQEP